MSLNNFDAAKHHIGLGPSAEYGFLLVGAYSKDSQGVNPDGTGQDFGGDNDLIAPAPQKARWTQDDFSGGAFQSRFEKDSGMFFDSLGIIPAEQSRSVITVPPTNYYAAVTNGSEQPVTMLTVAHSIYVCFPTIIKRYFQDTDAVTSSALGLTGGEQFVAMVYDRGVQLYYALVNDTSGVLPPRIVRFRSNFDQTGLSDYIAPSTALVLLGRGLSVTDQNILVSVGQQLYAVTPTVNPTSLFTGPSNWTLVGRLPGRWVDSTGFNGMTYILCAGAQGATFLVAFDGTAILPIVEFPYNFHGQALAVYGGRVYVGGTGADVTGGHQYAELYEVTGASLRLVRSWCNEAYQSRITYPKTIRALLVAEGLLWFAEDGVRLWTYDLTTDAFYGSSQLQDATAAVYKLVHGNDRIWAWADGASDGLYRLALSSGEVSGGTYSAKLTTSDFTVEPAMDKRWSEIVVLTRYGTAPTLEYSVNGGSSWTSLSVTVVTTGDLKYTTADLTGLALSRGIRFRFTLPRGSDVTTFTELIAYTVAFTFVGTSTPDKHAWAFTINASASIEGRDGTTVAQDLAAFNSTLWGWRNNKTQLSFKDFDGVAYPVQLFHLTENMPIVGPNATARPESFYAITLLEA